MAISHTGEHASSRAVSGPRRLRSWLGAAALIAALVGAAGFIATRDTGTEAASVPATDDYQPFETGYESAIVTPPTGLDPAGQAYADRLQGLAETYQGAADGFQQAETQRQLSLGTAVGDGFQQAETQRQLSLGTAVGDGFQQAETQRHLSLDPAAGGTTPGTDIWDFKEGMAAPPFAQSSPSGTTTFELPDYRDLRALGPR